MKRIKIAQIGTGHDHAYPTYMSLTKQSDIFDVAGWCAVDEEEGQQFHQCFTGDSRLTLDQILSMPDLDAVAVETDDRYLTKYALEAAKRGLDIHMDKPGAQEHDDFIALAKTVKEKNSVLQLGYMYRYNNMIADTINAARNGEYGKIYSVEAHMDCEHGAFKRQWLANFKGGMLYFLGCHLIDLVVSIQGIPDEVIPLSVCSGFDGVTGEDIGCAVLKYGNGVSYVKTSACEPGGFMRRQLVVCGEKGTAELRPLEEYVPDTNGELTTRMRKCTANRGWIDDGIRSSQPPIDRYDSMMADFAAMVRREKTNPYTLEYECMLHAVILACCGAETDYHAPVLL